MVDLTCVVTATNSAGSDSLESGAATITTGSSGPTNISYILNAVDEDVVIPFTGSPAQGDVVFIIAAADNGNNQTDLLQTTGYTFPDSNLNDSGGSSPARLFAYKVLGATPDTSVTLRDHAARGFKTAVLIQIWSGLGSFLNNAAASQGSGSAGDPILPPPITPSSAPARIFIAGLLDDDDAASLISPPSGYGDFFAADTGQGGTSDGATAMIASKEVSTTATETPGAFTGSSDASWSITLAFAV